MKQKSVELISSAKLATWIKTKQNVLFEGKHGVGKTSIILEAFKKAGLKYLYFSGATMDPFIDFVGVPVKVGTKHGDVIQLIRPENLANSKVQAIFIDEFNRTHKKVRNAVMELIQFKTINGKPLSPDLQIVWAAVNPDNIDGENDYDTDHLDPAQRDRFQIHVNIPYACSLDYLTKKFGQKTAETSIKWWNTMDEKIRDKVSPRRLEYALSEFKRHGDMRDVLPPESNVSQLMQLLKHKGKTLDDLVKSGNIENIKSFFRDENNYNLYVDELIKTKKYHTYVHLLPSEKIMSLLGSKRIVMKRIIIKGMHNKKQKASFGPVLVELETASQNASLARWAHHLVKRFKLAPSGKSGKALTKTVKAPRPTSSLGMLIKLLGLGSKNPTTEKELKATLGKLRNKYYSQNRFQNLLNQAKAWFALQKLSHVVIK